MQYPITVFPTLKANKKVETTLKPAHTLCPKAWPNKKSMPLIAMAAFGDKRTPKGSLRSDNNVTATYGVPLDYDNNDGRDISPEWACEAFSTAGIRVEIYTSPSHTDEHPRWRGLMFYSMPFIGPTAEMQARHKAAVAVAEKVVGCQFSPESSRLSQSYYIGQVEGAPYVAYTSTGDKFIDEYEDLDQLGFLLSGPDGTGESVPVEERLGKIRDGEDLHDSLVSITARWAVKGLSLDEIVRFTQAELEESDAPQDSRWQERYDSIERYAKGALDKIASGEWEAHEPVEEVDLSLNPSSKIRDLIDLPPLPPTPHMLNVLTDYAERTAMQPQPELNLFASITIAGAIMHDYRTNASNHPVLYMLNIAGTATGKDRAKGLVSDVFNALNTPEMIRGSGFSSASGCTSMYLQRPTGVMVIDEFGKELEAMASDSMKNGAMKMMMEAWSSAHSLIASPQMSNLTTHNPMSGVTVQNPRVSLLGLTTPRNYLDAIKDSDLASGQLNRFLICQSKRKRQMAKMPEDISVPTEFLEWAREVTNRGAMVILDGDGEQFVTIPFSDAAQTALYNFEKDVLLGDQGLYAQLENKGIEHLISRTREKAMRLALIGQLAEDPQSEEISGQVMEWGIGLALRCDLDMCAMFFENRVGDSHYARAKECVERYFAQPKMRAKALSEQGVKVRDIYLSANKADKFMSETPTKRQEILVAMCQEGVLVRNNLAKKGRKATFTYWLPSAPHLSQ